MADPLSLLRQYNVGKREISEKGIMICFGEYCWPKTVNTNYLVYGSTRDGPNKEYYTLECLLFFLRNVNLLHAVYVKQAAAENIPVVRRPDRRDLLAYLSGETASTQSIDKSAHIEVPVSISEVLKSFGDGVSVESASISSAAANTSASEDVSGPSSNKMARLDMQRAREQFSARLDAPKIKKPSTAPGGGPGSLAAESSLAVSNTSLIESMSIEKINALKAKRLAKKRSTIIDAENDIDREGNQNNITAGGPSILFQYDSDITREIQSKERIWRNRSTILQSTGKNFAKSVFPILQSIKSREEGSLKKPQSTIVAPTATTPAVVPTPMAQRLTTPAMMQQMSQQQYNRYDQERFTRNDTSIGFRIDTTGTYHGLTLKSVTEGPVATKPSTPATPQTYTSHQPVQSPSPSNKPQKRTSKTPIIIIPATTTSLITMYNAKAILQDLRFVEGKSGSDHKRENETLVQRRKPDNTTVPYRIIDNPLKLAPQDWDRVVAVFVQGPAWQFKGWPYDGNPVEIFARIKAFNLKFDEMKLDANVAKWNVEVIELSRTKRHLDRANLLKFWGNLDAFMIKHKHYLRF